MKINLSLYLICDPLPTFWQIFEQRFLDKVIIDLCSGKHTGESQKKSRNHDLPKCGQEITFEIISEIIL